MSSIEEDRQLKSTIESHLAWIRVGTSRSLESCVQKWWQQQVLTVRLNAKSINRTFNFTRQVRVRYTVTVEGCAYEGL